VEPFDEGHLRLLMAIAAVAATALEQRRVQVESLEGANRQLQAQLNLDHNMVGDSAPMRDVYRRIFPASRRPIRPCSSQVRAAPAKSWSLAPIHRNSPRAEKTFRRDQLRGHHRERCSRASCSATRRARSLARSRRRKESSKTAERRHGLPRRDWRAVAGPFKRSCCVCCRSITSIASAAQKPRPRGFPPRCRDQQRSRRGHREAASSVATCTNRLKRRVAGAAAAQGAAGGHRAARRLVHQAARRQGEAPSPGILGGSARVSDGVRLARQTCASSKNGRRARRPCWGSTR